MIIQRQKSYSIKYNPNTKKYEGKVDWKDKAKSAAILGATGAGIGTLLGGTVNKPGKGALIGAGLGAGLSAYFTRQSQYDRHNKKVDQENERRQKEWEAGRPIFASSEINKYRNKPELKWLPKEYWKLLDIELRLKDLFPKFGDGDEYVNLYVIRPWDINEIYDFSDKICHPCIISLGDQKYDDIGYYSKSRKWFIGYDDYDGYFEGEKPIPNLKQFLIKAFQDDLVYMKRNEFGWEDEEVQSVIQYQEKAIQLLKTL